MHPHSHPIVGVVIFALFVCGSLSAFLAVADFTELNQQIAQALRQAFQATGYQHKEIYMPMRYSKGQWSKVMSGEKTLSLVRLHCAPFKFYVSVWQQLIAIKAHDFATELREDAGRERRASERTHAA